MFEHRSQPLLPRPAFYRRLLGHAVMAGAILAACLGVGMAGYHFLERLSWLDAFVNASMILSGMGPVAELKTSAGKLFAGCYALFSGVAFLTTIGLLLAPIAHRLLHQFHLEQGKRSS
jgi:hypothetical protein